MLCKWKDILIFMLKITWEMTLIQSVNCVPQDMSVLPRCLVSHANQLLVQRSLKFYMLTDIFYTFLSACPKKVINLHNKNV